MFPGKFNVISNIYINRKLKSKIQAKHYFAYITYICIICLYLQLLTFLLFEKEIQFKLQTNLPMYLIDKFK